MAQIISKVLQQLKIYVSQNFTQNMDFSAFFLHGTNTANNGK